MVDEIKGEMPETPAGETPAKEQDEFDKERAMATIEKLRGFEKEAEKLRKIVAAQEEQERKRKEAEMTELEKAQKRLAELEGELTREKRTRMQTEIAAKIGLPAKLADRLKGETPEEMEQDAASILETLPKASPPPKPAPGIIVNPGGNAGSGETDAQRRARLGL